MATGLIFFACLFLGSPLNVKAQSFTFPSEGEQVLAEKGDVSYFSEQCAAQGVRTPGATDANGRITMDTCTLTGTNASMVCTYGGPRNTFRPVNSCRITYSDTGNVRTLTPNLIDGARDVLTTPTGEVITVADGGVNGETDAEGNTVASANTEKCDVTNIPCHLAKLPGMLLTGIAFLLLTLAGLLLFLAGTIFNLVVIRTVFQFGDYFGSSEGLLAAWGVVRDLANIGLLFGFILMGVLLILNLGGGGHGGGGINPKKSIPRLIIFAILLNFSLFASQAVIDVANAFSSSLTSLAGQEQCAPGTTGSGQETQTLEACANDGISGRILEMAGVATIWDSETRDKNQFWNNLVDRPYSYAVSLMMLSLFVLIAAVVLLAGAIMLIIRVVVLLFLMVTSPIGFAGFAIPKMEKFAADWWHQLLNQSFFAPLYLLMIFISIKLSESLMDGSASLADAVIANQGDAVAGNIQVVMVFLIVIGFMIGSLMIASKMGAMGAGFAMNSASALTFGAMTRMTNAGVGGGARLARVGIQNSRFRDSGAAKVAVNRMLRPLEGANLDLRRAGLGAALGKAGITAGAKPAEHASFNDMTHSYDEFGIARKKRREALDREYRTEIIDQDLHHGKEPSEEDIKTIQSLNEKELLALHGAKEGKNPLLGYINDKQFEAYMKSKDVSEEAKENAAGIRAASKAKRKKDADGKEIQGSSEVEKMSPEKFEKFVGNDMWTPEQKEKFRETRYQHIQDLLEKEGNDDQVREALKDLTVKDYLLMRESMQRNARIAGLMPGDKRDELIKDTNFKAEVRAVYTEARDKGFRDGALGNTIRNMKANDIAGLDESIVTKTEALEAMNIYKLLALDPKNIRDASNLERVVAHLKARVDKDDAEGRELRAKILANPELKSRWVGNVIIERPETPPRAPLTPRSRV